MTHQKFFFALAEYPGQADPVCLQSGPDQATIERAAHSALRSWFTSHSTVGEPTIYVENWVGLRVYDAWIQRRRVRHVPTGETRVETPAQFWTDELRGWGDTEQTDAPYRMGHPLFDHPSEYECELLEPLVNPATTEVATTVVVGH